MVSSHVAFNDDTPKHRHSDGGALEERQAELHATREKATAALEVARGRFADQTAAAETYAGRLAATRAEEERLTAALDSQSQSKVRRSLLADDML